MSPRRRIYFTAGLILALLLMVGCGSQTAEPATAEDSEDSAPAESADVIEDEETADEEEGEEVAEEAEEAEEPALPPLPPERQPVEIITADGRTLEGYYYPAAVNPAPMVVLMHWAGGDMEDWREIAPWLQNRAAELSFDADEQIASTGYLSRQNGDPWLDPSWFPPMPPDVSFGVLIFNYGDYGNSQPGAIPESWAEDSRAAIEKASQLEGADPMQIAAIGASIGADGSVDGCYLFNDGLADGEALCLGAMSYSPGDYLTNEFTYADAVEALDLDGHPVWCLAAVEDQYSYVTCESAQGELYLPIYYPGGFHGMMLIQPEFYPVDPPLDVDTLVITQDFLEEVFGAEIN